jgi:hypothetical protein
VICLIYQSLRGWLRIARVEDVGEVVGRLLLFRPLHRNFLGVLRLCDSVLRTRALRDDEAANAQDQTSNRKDCFEIKWHDKPPFLDGLLQRTLGIKLTELERFKVGCVPAVLSRPASNFFSLRAASLGVIGLGRAQTKRKMTLVGGWRQRVLGLPWRDSDGAEDPVRYHK